MASNGSVGVNTASPTNSFGIKFQVNGNIQHGGLVMSSGNSVDQLSSHSVTVTVSTSFQDTGISSGQIPTGTYIVQLYANDAASGGTAEVYYSGVMAFYGGTTSDDGFSSEIDLHRGGGADNGKTLFLRTKSSSSSNSVKLQIAGSYTGTQAHTFTINLRRLI